MDATALRRLFRKPEPVPQGPLYEPVRRAMAEAQAYARSHGGEIQLVSVDENGDITLRLNGACRGCPMAGVTLKLGVERCLRELVPGVGKIRSI